MRVWDLHCDTPYELFYKKEPLTENSGQVSLKKAENFAQYAQVMAIWTDRKLSDEAAWEAFFKIHQDLMAKIPPEKATFCKTAGEADAAFAAGKTALFLMVEGARLLAEKIERLDVLASLGVRFLTLVWKGSDCIGGTYDTDDPLTPFGREVVEGCFARGMIVDVSHASGAVTDEVLTLAEKHGKPVVATHANSFHVCPHPRNLTDTRLKRIAALGGLVGVCMVPEHLAENGIADADSVCRHIWHEREMGLCDTIALGCDFDGTDKLPRNIPDLSGLAHLYDALAAQGLGEKERDSLFFGNAERFFHAYLA